MRIRTLPYQYIFVNMFRIYLYINVHHICMTYVCNYLCDVYVLVMLAMLVTVLVASLVIACLKINQVAITIRSWLIDNTCVAAGTSASCFFTPNQQISWTNMDQRLFLFSFSQIW